MKDPKNCPKFSEECLARVHVEPSSTAPDESVEAAKVRVLRECWRWTDWDGSADRLGEHNLYHFGASKPPPNGVVRVG